MRKHIEHSSSLPDLLRQLPLNVVELSFWEHIQTADQQHFRQTSRHCRLLANLLFTSRKLVDSAPWLDGDSDTSDEEPDLEALDTWHEVAAQRSKYLSSLPRLTSLTLSDWRTESALVALLAQYGAATGGRVTTLTLEGTPLLSIAVGCAVRLACPHLHTLTLHSRSNDHGVYADTAKGLAGDVLRPLKDTPLRSLMVQSDEFGAGARIGSAVLHSLRGLSLLQRLDLSLDRLKTAHMRPLTSLINLSHCRISASLSLHAVAPLFTLTRLTHLEILRLQRRAEEAQVAALFAPLAGLRLLQHLNIGSRFVVRDPAFAALRMLTQLTYLELGGIDLTHPAAGHLPALRQLRIPLLTPRLLLSTLLPLLPLTSLEGVWDAPTDLSLNVKTGGAADAAAQAAALLQVAQHLAAAPRLRVLRACLDCHGAAAHMSPRHMGEGLQPLAGRLECLDLDNVPAFGAAFAVLGAHLPALRRLVLFQCGVSDVALPAVVLRLPALVLLSLRYCTGVSAEGWLGLAAARGHPARLGVFAMPRVPFVVILECREVQQRLFGGLNLDFFVADED